MLLTSYDPFLREFDRVVQRAFGWAQPGAVVRSALPMDVIRRDEEVVLRFDLPGVKPEDVEVTSERGVLSVSARRAEETAEGESPYVRERVMGSFRRRVRLSDAVDTDRIEAAYDKGVLTVRLPLAEQAKPRKVEIKNADAPAITA